MKITQTRRYSDFVHDNLNRPITERDATKLRKLEASMRKYGFLPFPILVRRTGDKFKILDGQHRFAVAQKLDLALYFVETERDDIVIAECAAAQSSWRVFDYIATYATQGNKHYEQLIQFAKETELPLVQAAHLLFGETNNGNVQKRIRDGKFVVKDVEYAMRVAGIVNAVRRHATWALNNLSVSALSRLVRVSDFSEEQFAKKCDTFPHLLNREATLEAYSTMYDKLYNHASRAPIPLAFLARQAAVSRSNLGEARKSGKQRRAA